MSPRPPRIAGILTSWGDDRGFGLITPMGDASRVFAHISSFGAISARSKIGDTVVFEHGIGKNGRPQALNIHGPTRITRYPHGSNVGSFLAIFVFVAIYFALGMFWPIPEWVAVAYAAMSIATAIAYRIDKSQATNGGWRISELSLLTLGLLCGWPGAIVAQQLLRHKTIKKSFRFQFWLTVVANILAFAAIVFVIGTEAGASLPSWVRPSF